MLSEGLFRGVRTGKARGVQKAVSVIADGAHVDALRKSGEKVS